jgi:sec-independent protein translocase protein TatB
LELIAGMFDIGWSELIVIGVVALIAIGPKELPGALRALGHYMGKIRRMAADFQSQFQEAMREAEMADLKKQVDTLTSGFDPIETIRKDIESTVADKPPSALAAPETSSAGTTASDAPSAYAPEAQPAEAPPTEPAAAADGGQALADAPGAAKPGDRPA